MMADLMARDLDYVDFGPDADVAPYLATAQRLAATLDVRDGRETALADAAARIAGLGVAELLAELDFAAEACPLLFTLAELFGHAHPAAGWRGLASVPDSLLGLRNAQAQAALPDGAGRLVFWLAHREAGAAPPALYWIDRAHGCLRGPVADPGRGWQHGLLGMPGAALAVLPAGAAQPDSPGVALGPGASAAWLMAQVVLLSGLLCGACRRLREEAYAYAQVRRSGGKPIVQLQAVALRLANIALAEQNLALYAAAAAKPVHQRDPVSNIDALNVAYVTESAREIARDAMQVAAAHGYVAGLPFKRLFEQVHTLASVLASHVPHDGE